MVELQSDSERSPRLTENSSIESSVLLYRKARINTACVPSENFAKWNASTCFLSFPMYLPKPYTSCLYMKVFGRCQRSDF